MWGKYFFVCKNNSIFAGIFGVAMNRQPKISVIVAVYNAEKYLRRCIDSLLTQTFKDFEVLLINDGSTDGSGKICDSFAEKDKRFRVFHQENKGVAAARQKGTDEASGKYYVHVDPDDWVKPTMLEEMYIETLSEEPDMVICDYYEVVDSQSRYKTQRPQTLTPDVVIKDILSGRIMGSLCNKLIRHELYKKCGIRFVAGINYCEDVLICVQMLLNDVKVAYKENAYYYYDMTDMNSITRNYTAATYEMRKRYIAALKSILPSSYQKYIDWAALQVKAGAFVHGVMTAEEYKTYYPLSLGRILSSNQSPRIKVAFVLANMGLYRVGECFYKQYRAITARERASRPKIRNILLWADCTQNAGPSNVHRSLIMHSNGELHYVKSRRKYARYVELIWRGMMADVVIFPSFTSPQDVRLIRMLCRKAVCISHGCLKQECVINNHGRDYERVEQDERFSFSAAKTIVCVSEKHMQLLKSQYPEFAEKMTFVNNGVDVSPRNRVQKEERTIAVSGGNRNIKNNEYVCKAVQLLNERGFSCSVNVFGRQYSDGADLSAYPNVHYVGHLDKEDYYRFLDKIELFVVASELESFGLVVADALNCHCSLLMSHNVGAASIMKTTEDDFVSDPHDIEELAKRIRHLLEYPNATRLLDSVDVYSCSEKEAWIRMKAVCDKL